MESQTRNCWLWRFAFVVAVAAVFAVLAVGVQPAQAETFKEGTASDGYTTTVSSAKRSFYVSSNVLYVKTKSATKKLKKLPVSDDVSWTISAAYKNKVYLTKSSFNKWRLWTYVYYTKTKKFKKARTDCSIAAFKGAYAYAVHDFRSDVSAVRMDIYKMTSSGLKHIRKLAKYGFTVKIIGKKLYYTSASDSSMHKNSLYKAKLNGKGKKKIATFKCSSEYGQAIIMDITKKTCKVYKDTGQYLYTYKTKKLTKIS